jgi:hypothetical protein
MVSVNGKTSDMCIVTVAQTGIAHDGYVPTDAPFHKEYGFGDYIEFDLCLNCGQMQGTFPASEMEYESK